MRQPDSKRRSAADPHLLARVIMLTH